MRAPLVFRLSDERVAVRTEGQNLAPPGGGVVGIAVAGGHGKFIGSGPGAEGAAVPAL